MTTEKRLSALDEPGMKEVRPGVWHLRAFVGRRANGSPVQRRRVVDSGMGKVNAGVREARTEMAKMRAEVESEGTKRTAVAARYTVAKLLERYIAHCEQQDRSPTTVYEYRRMADKVLVPRFGSMKVDDLDQDHLDAFYAELKAKGLKSNSIRRAHSLMSASLRFGLKKRLVRQNVAALASPPPPVHAEVTAPTLQQVKAVIDAAEAKDDNKIMATAVTLAALTGLRRGELCGLRWSDIDFVTETLTIASSVYEDGSGGWGLKEPKTRQKRRLGLDPVTIEALRRHRAAVEALADSLELDLPADAFVFSISPQGSEPLRPGLVSERYAMLAKKAGVNPRFHALRHFHATRAIADGHDVVTVSHRLGHSDPSMTLRIYAHALEQRDRDLAAAMGAELSSLGTGASTMHTVG